MIIDFASEFADLLIPWTGTRPGVGTDNDAGQYAPGVPSALDFMAVPTQPINSHELRQQEGGEFVSSWEKSYTPFFIMNNDTVTDGDTVYLVMQVERRNKLGGYYKFFCRKVQNDV